MTEDFLRLVSQANPAARPPWPRQQQYQPANNGNGYPDRSDALMDPFFDDHDDDENIPDSAFGPIPVQGPMRSQESQLPLSRAAAPPAGGGGSESGASQSQELPPVWNFDDDDFISNNEQTFPGSSNYPPPHPPQKPKTGSPVSRKHKWKWPWRKEKTLAGERVIALNNSAANGEFCSNHVSTSKYNLVTFLPKFLFGKLYLGGSIFC